MRNFFFLILLAFYLLSCQSPVDNSVRNITPVVDSSAYFEPRIKVIKGDIPLLTNRDSINDFLNEPFDLFKFKEKKRGANSGGGTIQEYFFSPNKEGMYYRYFLFEGSKGIRGYIGREKDKSVHRENGLEITVYKKLGKYRYKYTDPTEELIEVIATFNDFDLPELAFVGIDSASIIYQLGEPDLFTQNCLLYENENKVLILKLENSNVKWLKYVKLKMDYNILESEDLFEI
ncbi:hypothetical protein [Owenweeksia hongkongensis]|uniref:hypothetical protein n=1 Tax=Owenweeksia hongkongensis TaxID=253245 RepID=UPI003A930665